MLQPKDLFATLQKIDIPQLVRQKNDKFWEIPIKDYSKILKGEIQKSTEIPSVSKGYLKGLVDFMEGNVTADNLKKLYVNSGKQMKTEDLIKNFNYLNYL